MGFIPHGFHADSDRKRLRPPGSPGKAYVYGQLVPQAKEPLGLADRMEISRRVKAAREAKGLLPREVAGLAGVSLATVYAIESAMGGSRTSLGKVAGALGIDISPYV